MMLRGLARLDADRGGGGGGARRRPAAELSAVEAPLGVIWGVARPDRPDHDAAPDPRRRAGRRVVETIPRAAHVPQVERPDEFVVGLERVLDRLSK